ncbi:uncharacterized protein LOC143916893 [Arctopsyche grandis]|uniref:uncharacterized protein LOC143916893 n=1 Tax=Arctopsyche grandis TaxID=121162 RepID=UPI00406D9C49
METLGEIFPIERGVRQGDPLSPKLFSAVIEEIFKEMDWSKFGIKINGSNLNHLRFADDLVLFSDNSETLQVTLQDLATKSKKVGLTLSKTKTKAITKPKVSSRAVISEITNVEDVGIKAKTLKWRWTGHMIRYRKEKWSIAITEWTPHYKAKRKRGRQRKRWSDGKDGRREEYGKVWRRPRCHQDTLNISNKGFEILKNHVNGLVITLLPG